MTNTLPADERPIDSARKLLKYLPEFAPDYEAQDRRILRVSERLLDLESDENSYTLTITKLREENERLREALQLILLICETRLNESPEIHFVADAAWSALKGDSND